MSGRPAPSGPPARLLLADPDHQAMLDMAADDALTKPFGIGQLLDRLQALRDPAHSPTRQRQDHFEAEQEAGAQ